MRKYGHWRQYLTVIFGALIVGVAISFVSHFWERSNHIAQSFTVQSFGALGAPVSLQVKGGLPTSDQPILLESGSGDELKKGDQLLYIVSSFTYTPGRVLQDNKLTQIHAGTVNESELGELSEAIIGQRVGARVADTNTNIAQNSTEIVVIDILPTRISGTHIQPAGWPGNPAVNNSPQLLPQIVGQGEPPTELKVHDLVAGNGDQVAAGDQIYANYLLVDFSGKVMKDTYRDPHPVKIDTSKIFAGLRQGIIDQRIGSRLLIGIPARLAHGEKNLLAVVDLLGKVENATETSSDS